MPVFVEDFFLNVIVNKAGKSETPIFLSLINQLSERDSVLKVRLWKIHRRRSNIYKFPLGCQFPARHPNGSRDPEIPVRIVILSEAKSQIPMFFNIATGRNIGRSR